MTLKRISQMKARMVLIEVKVQSFAKRSGGRIARRVMIAPRQALCARVVSIRVRLAILGVGVEDSQTYGTKRPMEMDQRILTGKRVDVLQTIHTKDSSCPIHKQIVSAAEATRNQYCECQKMVPNQSQKELIATGGEAWEDKLIPMTITFARNHIARIPERASTLRKKSLLRAVFLTSMLYASMIQPCDTKNRSIAARTVCSSRQLRSWCDLAIPPRLTSLIDFSCLSVRADACLPMPRFLA
jgi:hypothetical protein